MSPRLLRAFPAALLLGGCAYDVPLDPDAPTVNNVLSGTVVVNGTDQVADTVILIYTADNPPPPTGTGRPVSFATVPASAFSTDAGGIPAAPWALTDVPDGEWLVTALMDVDGNFQPLLGATAGSTCGDWIGAYFTDLSTSEYATIAVAGGVLVDDITVVIGRENAIQRPAWAFTIDDTHDATIAAISGEGFQIHSTGVGVDLGVGTYDLDGPYDAADPDPCATAFWQYAPDTDGDGEADPHPNENLADAGYASLWPRIYLRYLGEMPEGEYYGTEAIALASALHFGLPPVNTPVPLTTYDIATIGKAIHFYPDGTEEIVESDDIPRGPWSVTVVQYTGQTWTLPNDFAEFPSTEDGFDAAGQSMVLTIE